MIHVNSQLLNICFCQAGKKNRRTEDKELAAALKASLANLEKGTTLTSYSIDKTPSQIELDEAIKLSLSQDANNSSEEGKNMHALSCRIVSRDMESKDFLFDFQLLVPKIVRESDSQLPSPKYCQTLDSTSLS